MITRGRRRLRAIHDYVYVYDYVTAPYKMSYYYYYYYYDLMVMAMPHTQRAAEDGRDGHTME